MRSDQQEIGGRAWLRRALARLRSDAPNAKASRAAPLVALEALGQPVWSPRDYAAFAREGLMQNAVVYRCVRMIAEAAASVPLLLYEGDEELETHPLRDLIARPNPGQVESDLFESWYGFLLVAGNAYLEAAAVGGRLRELHALRPDRMRVVPGADGWPEGFEYAAAGHTARLGGEAVPGVRRVLHVKLFHPVNDHYGLSPLEAAATAVDLHNTASRWNKALLDNSARPSGALVYTSGGHLTGEQFERLKAELEDSFQGARNAGRPLLLEGGLDWKAMSLSPKDMDFIGAKHLAAREIALALGVPPMLLGIPGDNTFSNYQEATRSFWRQTVLPLVARTAKALSAWLAPAWGGALTLRPDLDQIEALSAEREALWARLEKASFLTADEKRAAVGYGPAGARDVERAEKANLNPSQLRDDRGRWADEGGGSFVHSTQGDRPSGYRIDLLEEEERGGHSVAKHVGKNPAQLLATAVQLQASLLAAGSRNIPVHVGTFPSLEAADRLVSSALAQNRALVEEVASGRMGGDFIVTRFGSPTGSEAFAHSLRSVPYIRATHAVGVLIRHDPSAANGFAVVAAYPIP
jgi:HK97 family phage portal protein